MSCTFTKEVWFITEISKNLKPANTDIIYQTFMTIAV
jgi:hypothetical protein